MMSEFSIIVKKATDNKAWIENKIKEYITMGIDEFSKIADGKSGKVILYFFALPKSDLHKEFSEKILSHYKEKKCKNYELGMIKRLMKNTKDASIDERTKNDVSDKHEYHQVYKIANEYRSDKDEYILIGIPYVFQEKNGRNIVNLDKWAFSETIVKSEHPNIFENIIHNRKQYTKQDVVVFG